LTLNKQKGKMYEWVTHTWNPIRGECEHDCSYCYMKMFKVGELRLDPKTLADNLGEGNFIFVGSSTDMFGRSVPHSWISEVLAACRKASKNKYLFQSKDPVRFKEFLNEFPKGSLLGTTIESDLGDGLSKAPPMLSRVQGLQELGDSFKKMVSIEPVFKFTLERMVEFIEYIKPSFVSIGADSTGNKLEEPSKEELEELIKELKKLTEVVLKPNLKRLMR